MTWLPLHSFMGINYKRINRIVNLIQIFDASQLDHVAI